MRYDKSGSSFLARNHFAAGIIAFRNVHLNRNIIYRDKFFVWDRIAQGGLMGPIRGQAGLNQFEFMMVVIAIALLWMVALNRLRNLQEIAEKTTVEMTVRNIQSGLRWEMSERIVAGREASIAELAGGNPVRWLGKPPVDYLGEFSAAPADFLPGRWYFDTQRKELRYRPTLQRNLECTQCVRESGEIVLSWRIERAGNPMFGRGDTVRVVTAAPYRWF